MKTIIFAAMKRLFFIGFLFLFFVMIACSKQETPPPHEEDMLYRVECFYQKRPDSAFRALDTLDVSVLSKKERAHYCLLLARTMSHLYMNQTVIDSLLDEAEDYYSGSDEKYYEAMTYWQKGWKTSVSGRMDYRQKAVQTIEQCKHVDKRLLRCSETPTDEQDVIDRLKYAIYQRLGMSYVGSGYHKDGIKYLKLSEQYYKAVNRYELHLASAYMLSHAYTLINENDSSLFYLKRGLQSAEAIGNIAECAYYHIGVSDHCLYRHDTQQYADEDERLELLHRSIEECREALWLMDTINERMVNGHRIDCYGTMARAFNLLQQYDSCIYYGEIVLNVLGDGTSKFLLKNLYNSYKALGDEKNVARISERLLNLPDDNGAEQKAVAQVKDEYDKQLEIQRLESEQQLKRYRLFLWIALLVIVLMAVLWTAFRYRKNKELETLKLREAQRQLQAELEQLTAQQKEMLNQQVMAIYQTGQKDRLQHIMEAFESAYPKGIEKMKSAYPDLSKTELNLVVLSFLQFRTKEEADLLGLSENTVMKYRSNLKKKADFDLISALIG